MEESVQIVRTPEMIAGEINYIKQKASEKMISYCIDIGNRLKEAKALVQYGEWTSWLRDNVDYSQSKAEQLMHVAEEYGDEQINLITGKSKSETFRNIGFSQALALLALPDPERAEFVESHDMESISVRELQEEIKTLKAEREEAERRANEDSLKAENAEKEEKKKRTEAEKNLKSAKRIVADLEKRENELKDQLAAAQKEAQEARNKVDELQAQEPEQPSMEDTVSEEQIEEIRNGIREEYAQKLAAASNEHLHAFKFALEQFQQDFRRMEIELNGISGDLQTKLKGKVADILAEYQEKMSPEDDTEESPEE